MTKPTKAQTVQMIDELLSLQPVVERYRLLETDIKAAMRMLEMAEVETRSGRVFISVSERMAIEPKIVRDVLGLDLAGKIIKVKESVSNKLLVAFREVGDISEAQMDELRKKAKKTVVTNLHVRPLK